ncbi:MAG: hypothetical protein E2P02_14525 [Acidobacteria bacterium]|nr:MAG: hypothetical protein E2P02_14525 [Acidobacteriota bacterium]
MRILFLLALLAQSPKELAERHFDHAYELLGKKLYVKAIDQFLYVLALDPSHHDAHFYAGLAYIQRGLTGLEQADHHLSRAIELDPRNPRQFHYRGVVRMRLGAYEEAVSDLQHMLAAEDDYYLSLYSLGATLMRLERYREAVDILKRAVDANPSLLEPRWNLALAMRFAGEDPASLPTKYRLELSTEGIGPSPIVFEDVAERSGITRYSRARGSGWSDVDGDGDLDLFAVGIHDPHALYRNDGNGTFTDITVDSGLFDPTGGWSALWADYDNDGDPDLYVTRDGWDGELPNSLYRNDEGVFIDVAERAGVAGARDSFTAAFADIDHDGDLDLYVANGVATEGGSPNELFLNNGNGTFTEVADRYGVANHGRSIGSAFGDYDNDGWPDLLVVNFFGHPALYHNNQGQSFSNVSRSAGITRPYQGFVGFFFDYDNDGWLDIFIVGFAAKMEEALRSARAGAAVNEASRLALYRNNQDGTFTELAEAAGLAKNFGAMAASFGDIDNDGYLDIYLGCGAPAIERFEPNKLFLNGGNGVFTDISAAAGVDHLGKGHGVSFADYDGDGDLDIYVPTGGAFLGDRQADALYRNPGTSNHWLHVKLRGTTGHRDAVGAQVRVRFGETLVMQEVTIGGGFGSTNSLILEFGLGEATSADELEIRWPAGARRVLHNVAADQRILVVEAKPGYELLP